MITKINYFQTPEFDIVESTFRKPMSDMHYHSAYEIYYVVKGERDYFINNQFYKAVDNDIVIIPPNMLHRTEGKGAKRILVYFTDGFLRQYFSNELLNNLLPSLKPGVYRPSEKQKEHLHSTLYSILMPTEQKRFSKNKIL